MTYQLWNLETGNAIGEFDTEAEALAFVRETADEHGQTAASNWGLTETSPDGETSIDIGQGMVLLARAMSVPAQTRRAP